MEKSRFSMRHLWLTDCESLRSCLLNPIVANIDDKRLEIDFEDLRQTLCEDADGNPKDDLTVDQSDQVRWIDTSTMPADPLTKIMKSERLEATLANNILDLERIVASQMQKLIKQTQRSKKMQTADQTEEFVDDGRYDNDSRNVDQSMWESRFSTKK